MIDVWFFGVWSGLLGFVMDSWGCCCVWLGRILFLVL